MGMFIIKILLSPLAVIEMWINIITALILWDTRPMEREWLFDIIWRKPK